MGNCLVPQERKVIEILRLVDGEIMQFQSPVRVQQVLDEFPGHAIAGNPDAATPMRHGQLCCLPPPPPGKMPAIEEKGGGGHGGAIKVKVVLSKKELKELLSKGDQVSHGDMMMALLRREGRRSRSEKERRVEVEWKPTLERIPEGRD